MRYLDTPGRRAEAPVLCVRDLDEVQTDPRNIDRAARERGVLICGQSSPPRSHSSNHLLTPAEPPEHSRRQHTLLPPAGRCERALMLAVVWCAGGGEASTAERVRA